MAGWAGRARISLAERRAEARELDDEMKRHRASCPGCVGRARCAEHKDMAAELAAIRQDIKHWFDPGPDQGTLL